MQINTTAFPVIGLDSERSVFLVVLVGCSFWGSFELSYQNEIAALIFLVNKMKQDFTLNTLNLKQTKKTN